jgi:hypothetical protein
MPVVGVDSYIAVHRHSDGTFRSYRPVVNAFVQNLTLENTEVTASKGFVQTGLIAKEGEFSGDFHPYLRRLSDDKEIEIQLDQISRWPGDNSIRFAVMNFLEDEDLSQGDHAYELRKRERTIDNSSTLTLADITNNTDFVIEITNNQRYNGSSNEADPVGASLFASFNELSQTSTRVTKLYTGAVCEGWEVWGYFNTASDHTGTDHPNLKARILVQVYKNTNGTINDYKVSAVITQDRWDATDKYRQDYDATLKDGVTTIASYTGLEHPFHAMWAMVDKDTSINSLYARPFWRTQAPTLHYKVDKSYWRESNLLYPFDDDIDASSGESYTEPFIPLENMAHNSFKDQSGGSAGRGMITNPDIIALMTGDALRQRQARTQAHAGLHEPNSFRSHQTRTRPSETADEANTIIPLIMGNPIDGDPNNDFTADGMPVSQHAYRNGSASFQGGYTAVTGGEGVWTTSANHSHTVSYSYYQYLLECEYYHYQSMLDTAFGPVYMGNDFEGAGTLTHVPERPRPSGTWPGNLLRDSQPRGWGWGALVTGQLRNILPEGSTEENYIKSVIDHACEYLYQCALPLEQNQKDVGIFFMSNTQIKRVPLAYWEYAFVNMGFWTLEKATGGHRGIVAALDINATYCKGIWSEHRYRIGESFCKNMAFSDDGWDATTNPFGAVDDIWYRETQASYSSATNTFTITSINDLDYVNLANDDQAQFWDRTAGNVSIPAPSTYSEGTTYYIVNATGTGQVGDTFQLSTTQGGSPVTAGDADRTTVRLFFKPADGDKAIADSEDMTNFFDNHYQTAQQLTGYLINEYNPTLFSTADLDIADNFMTNKVFTSNFAFAGKRV